MLTYDASRWYLDEETRRAASSAKGHSKTAAAAGSVSDADRQRIGRALDACAAQHQLSLAPQTDAMRARQKRVVCSLLHGGGLVVPVVKNVGYRPVPSSEAELKKTLRAICEAPAASRDKLMDPLCELVRSLFILVRTPTRTLYATSLHFEPLYVYIIQYSVKCNCNVGE